MPIRIALILSILTMCLAGGCASKPPPFPMTINDTQQDALAAIYLSVWRESIADSKRIGGASIPRIHNLLALESDRIRATLDDEQWEMFDTQTKDDWVDKIYRSTRNLSPVQSSGPYTTAPSSIGGSTIAPPAVN